MEIIKGTECGGRLLGKPEVTNIKDIKVMASTRII